MSSLQSESSENATHQEVTTVTGDPNEPDSNTVPDETDMGCNCADDPLKYRCWSIKMGSENNPAPSMEMVEGVKQTLKTLFEITATAKPRTRKPRKSCDCH